jgi:hypothetical protein
LIPDLPAPREASTSFVRTLIIIFGSGYSLVGIAWAALVAWYGIQYLERVVLKTFLAPMSYSFLLFLGILNRLVEALVFGAVFLIVAFGARCVYEERNIDLRAALHSIRRNWRGLLAIALLWSLVSEVFIDLASNVPSFLVERVHLSESADWLLPGWIYLIIATNSLIAMCMRWSLLSGAIDRARVLPAFLDGVIGPWKQGARTVTLAAAFALLPFFKLQLRDLVGDEFGQLANRVPTHALSGLLIAGSIADAFVEAVFFTVLSILLAVVFAERKDQPNAMPALGAQST